MTLNLSPTETLPKQNIVHWALYPYIPILRQQKGLAPVWIWRDSEAISVSLSKQVADKFGDLMVWKKPLNALNLVLPLYLTRKNETDQASNFQ